jgi:hypothetical protein
MGEPNKKGGISTIIATLLLVSIAVIAAIAVFVFFQDVSKRSQVEQPKIESVEIFGYDARDDGTNGSIQCSSSTYLASHNDACIFNVSGPKNNKLSDGDAVLIYLRIRGQTVASIQKLVFHGIEYTFDSSTGQISYVGSVPGDGKFCFATTIPTSQTTSCTGSNTIEQGPYGEVTLVIRYDADTSGEINLGRSMVLQITTTEGSVFSSTIKNGSHK